MADDFFNVPLPPGRPTGAGYKLSRIDYNLTPLQKYGAQAAQGVAFPLGSPPSGEIGAKAGPYGVTGWSIGNQRPVIVYDPKISKFDLGWVLPHEAGHAGAKQVVRDLVNEKKIEPLYKKYPELSIPAFEELRQRVVDRQWYEQNQAKLSPEDRESMRIETALGVQYYSKEAATLSFLSGKEQTPAQLTKRAKEYNAYLNTLAEARGAAGRERGKKLLESAKTEQAARMRSGVVATTSASGVYSTAYGNFIAAPAIVKDGAYSVVIPTAVNGRRLTYSQAVERYQATGQHAGKYLTEEAAERQRQAMLVPPEGAALATEPPAPYPPGLKPSERLLAAKTPEEADAALRGTSFDPLLREQAREPVESRRIRLTVTKDEIPSEGRALLDTIAELETNWQRYDETVTGKYFALRNEQDQRMWRGVVGGLHGHPNVGASPLGQYSTASGRYQTTRTTWLEDYNRFGLTGDFRDPRVQDAWAWRKSEDIYRRWTRGRDLETDLRERAHSARYIQWLGHVLSQEWTPLPGGLQPHGRTKYWASYYARNLELERNRPDASERIEAKIDRMIGAHAEPPPLPEELKAKTPQSAEDTTKPAKEKPTTPVISPAKYVRRFSVEEIMPWLSDDDARQLAGHIADLYAVVADMQRRVHSMIRHGRVTDVDTKQQLVRLELSTDEESMKSGWVPYQCGFGAAFKAVWHPSVGQNMTLFSPGGDPAQSVAIPFTFNKQYASPSTDAGEQVLADFGKSRISVFNDKMVLKVGASIVQITDGKISTVKATYLGLDDVNDSGPKVEVIGDEPAKQTYAKK